MNITRNPFTGSPLGSAAFLGSSVVPNNDHINTIPPRRHHQRRLYDASEGSTTITAASTMPNLPHTIIIIIIIIILLILIWRLVIHKYVKGQVGRKRKKEEKLLQQLRLSGASTPPKAAPSPPPPTTTTACPTDWEEEGEVATVARFASEGSNNTTTTAALETTTTAGARSSSSPLSSADSRGGGGAATMRSGSDNDQGDKEEDHNDLLVESLVSKIESVVMDEVVPTLRLRIGKEVRSALLRPLVCSRQMTSSGVAPKPVAGLAAATEEEGAQPFVHHKPSLAQPRTAAATELEAAATDDDDDQATTHRRDADAYAETDEDSNCEYSEKEEEEYHHDHQREHQQENDGDDDEDVDNTKISSSSPTTISLAELIAKARKELKEDAPKPVAAADEEEGQSSMKVPSSAQPYTAAELDAADDHNGDEDSEKEDDDEDYTTSAVVKISSSNNGATKKNKSRPTAIPLAELIAKARKELPEEEKGEKEENQEEGRKEGAPLSIVVSSVKQQPPRGDLSTNNVEALFDAIAKRIYQMSVPQSTTRNGRLYIFRPNSPSGTPANGGGVLVNVDCHMQCITLRDLGYCPWTRCRGFHLTNDDVHRLCCYAIATGRGYVKFCRKHTADPGSCRAAECRAFHGSFEQLTQRDANLDRHLVPGDDICSQPTCGGKCHRYHNPALMKLLRQQQQQQRGGARRR